MSAVGGRAHTAPYFVCLVGCTFAMRCQSIKKELSAPFSAPENNISLLSYTQFFIVDIKLFSAVDT